MQVVNEKHSKSSKGMANTLCYVGTGAKNIVDKQKRAPNLLEILWQSGDVPNLHTDTQTRTLGERLQGVQIVSEDVTPELHTASGDWWKGDKDEHQKRTCFSTSKETHKYITSPSFS